MWSEPGNPDCRLVTPDEFLAGLEGAAADDLQLTYCAFGRTTPRWCLQDRTLAEHLLYYVVDGQINGQIAGQEWKLKPYGLLWTSSHTPHSFTLGGLPTVSYSLRFRLWQDGQPIRLKAPVTWLPNRPQLRGAFDRLFLACQHPLRWQHTRLKALLLELFVQVLAAAPDGAASQNEDESGPVFSHNQLLTLNEYLDGHLAQNPMVGNLAELYGWTVDYFSRRFHRHFGVSPRTWLTQERIRRAAALLLESHLSIKEVAAAVGYDDQRFFSRQFRRLNGLGPREFRRQH